MIITENRRHFLYSDFLDPVFFIFDHRTEIEKLTFRALALRQSESIEKLTFRALALRQSESNDAAPQFL